ncbi:MAG: hypothetical protein ACKO3K_00890 [Cuspidothrix sp.]
MKEMFSNENYQSRYLFLKKDKSPIGFQIDPLVNKNQLFTTTNSTYRIEEYKPQNSENPKKKLIKICELEKLSTFREIVDYGFDTIRLKDDYFFNRIHELKELCDEEEDCDLSLESLKSMFLFIGTIANVSKPSSITVSESGLFYLEWEKDRNNSITMRFKKDYFLDYVIFRPSSHTSKRIILNGSMNTMDFIDYLNNLNIKIHKQI